MNTKVDQIRDLLHYALKKEQRVWGSGSEHEAARAEVLRIEKWLEEEIKKSNEK
jgi:hypothetical protein